ncbi:hypothetical protein ACH5RR_021980 [Cinchona calisaya]|uniref:Small auxin up regulated protein n=1 Tax=Cinchona calisaya TaxID=153742 RepID=A0ABD2Z7K1_9GENT
MSAGCASSHVVEGRTGDAQYITSLCQEYIDIQLLVSIQESIHITMQIRLPRIIQAKQILRRSSLDVPKGHIAVYVGENEKKRFVIPIAYLNQPSFQDLLNQTEEEFGYNHPMGGLTIPCREDMFIDLISCLSTNMS